MGREIFEFPSKDWICGGAIVRNNSKTPEPILIAAFSGTRITVHSRYDTVTERLQVAWTDSSPLYWTTSSKTSKSTFTVRPYGIILPS